jgi:site-specific recombinase XerD
MLQGKELQKAYDDYIINYSLEKGLKPGSIRNKKDVLKKLLPFLNGKPLTLAACREYTFYMYNNGWTKPNSRSNIIKNLRAFINFLYNHKYIKENFSRQLTKPKIPRKDFDYVDPETVERIIIAGTEHGEMDNSRNKSIKDEMRAALRFILRTGLRINELINLKGIDLNIYDNPPTFWVNSKGGNRELLPLPMDMIDEVKGRMERERVFNVTQKTCNDVLQRGAKKLGLSVKLTNHALRHIFASKLVKNGVPIQMVSRLMRHSGVGITDKTYTHLNVNDLALILNSKQKIIVGGLSTDDVFNNVEHAVLQTGIKEDKRFTYTVNRSLQSGEMVIRMNYKNFV